MQLMVFMCTGGLPGKESACSEGDLGSVPGLGGSPGEGNGNPIPVFLPGEFHGQTSPVPGLNLQWLLTFC